MRCLCHSWRLGVWHPNTCPRFLKAFTSNRWCIHLYEQIVSHLKKCLGDWSCGIVGKTATLSTSIPYVQWIKIQLLYFWLSSLSICLGKQQMIQVIMLLHLYGRPGKSLAFCFWTGSALDVVVIWEWTNRGNISVFPSLCSGNFEINKLF